MAHYVILYLKFSLKTNLNLTLSDRKMRTVAIGRVSFSQDVYTELLFNVSDLNLFFLKSALL